MKKFFTHILLVVTLFTSLFYFNSCKPKTGTARFSFSKDFEEVGENYYHLDYDDKGKTINFRKYVEVNNKTTWTLTPYPGKPIIENFTIHLVYGPNIYYVICSDRLGISNTYKINLHVERKTIDYYYIELDEDAIQAKAYQNYYYGNMLVKPTLFESYLYKYRWSVITGRETPGNSEFFTAMYGMEFNRNELPKDTPTKNGYTFLRWSYGTSMEDNSSQGYIHTVHTAIWN